MKGQLSYIIKPMSLLMIILLLVFLYMSINSATSNERKTQKNLDLVNSATNILLILANSRDCVAYKSSITDGLYANVVDVEKLKEFSEKYAKVEPECARSYDFGWRVKINEIDRDNPENFVETWSFGAYQFEDPNKDNKKGFRNSIEVSMPVAIRYSEKDVRTGNMRILIVDGEMEKIAGTLDWTCEMMKMKRLNSLSVSILTSYGLKYNKTSNLLCSDAKTAVCKVMSCPINFVKNMDSPGEYSLSIKYDNGELVVK